MGSVRSEDFSSNILVTLASVREDVERQVAKLDRYRALKAIDQTIADFPELDDLNRSLSEIRERMQQQIEGSREVRALRAVEKILPDLAQVLEFLAERSQGEVSDEPVEQPEFAPENELVDVTKKDPLAPVAEQIVHAAPDEGTISEPASAQSGLALDEQVTAGFGGTEPAHESSKPSTPLEKEPHSVAHSEAANAPSLAYSLAQMMVQAKAPPPTQSQPLAPPEGISPEATEVIEGSVVENNSAERAA